MIYCTHGPYRRHSKETHEQKMVWPNSLQNRCFHMIIRIGEKTACLTSPQL